MVKRDFIRDVILLCLLAAGIIALRVFVFDVYKVKPKEANSYLKAGDIVLINRMEKPKAKDFVLYRTKDRKKHLGRLIALPGQAVTAMDDILYLDHEALEETYLSPLKHQHVAKTAGEISFTPDFSIETLTEGQDQVLPKGYGLILNDNRQNEEDSRTFGPISQKDMIGPVAFRLFPLDDFGFVTLE